MELAVVILLIAAIITLCIPKPDTELRGETPAEQLADIGKGCGTVILGIVAFAVFFALVTWASSGTLDDYVEQTRLEQQRAGR
jgi:hypothetical protein